MRLFTAIMLKLLVEELSLLLRLARDSSHGLPRGRSGSTSIGIPATYELQEIMVLPLDLVDSSAITQLGNSLHLGAMVTTKEKPILLKSVTDNSGATCRTGGRKGVDRTLETIVGMRLSVLGYLECFVVIVSTGFTFGHSLTRLVLMCSLI
jgi:hypothetical protein